MAPTVLQSWNVDCPVIGLAWLEGPSLAVIQEQGTRTLIHLYNQQGEHPADVHPVQVETGKRQFMPARLTY